MSVFIEGFGISGYRSFGNETQRIAPLDKINLFIGQNNSGKSNILSFVSKHYKKSFNASKRNQAIPSFQELDIPRNIVNNQKSKFEFAYKKSILTKTILDRYPALSSPSKKTLFLKLLKSLEKDNNSELIWLIYDEENKPHSKRSYLSKQLAEKIIAEKILATRDLAIFLGILNDQQQQPSSHYSRQEPLSLARQILNKISPIQDIALPEIELIPAIRKIGEAGSKADDYSGLGIIDRLAKLQNPPYNQQGTKEKFKQINKFVQEVIDNSTAILEIPYERDMILVHMDNKTLPLTSLGMGIHEVIILGAAATVLEEQIICIEELEIHLHPILQKKLIRYLRDQTSNQYFITTHSAHLLDTPGAIGDNLS